MLLEFASATGERTYGWDNKINVALSSTELCTILASPDESHDFYHDPGGVMWPGMCCCLDGMLQVTAGMQSLQFFIIPQYSSQSWSKPSPLSPTFKLHRALMACVVDHSS